MRRRTPRCVSTVGIPMHSPVCVGSQAAATPACRLPPRLVALPVAAGSKTQSYGRLKVSQDRRPEAPHESLLRSVAAYRQTQLRLPRGFTVSVAHTPHARTPIHVRNGDSRTPSDSCLRWQPLSTSQGPSPASIGFISQYSALGRFLIYRE